MGYHGISSLPAHSIVTVETVLCDRCGHLLICRLAIISTVTVMHSSSPFEDPQRPKSALSQRYPRPPSSALRRPLSSASNRPPSSHSARPFSRLSQRPNSRHARSKLLPLCSTLVTQMTGLTEQSSDDDVFQNALEHAVKSLESTTLNKAAATVDLGVIDRQVHGRVQKAKIHSQDALAEALKTCYMRLKQQAGKDKDLDGEIQRSRLPDHLQFLIALSASVTPTTLAYAELYLEGIQNPPSVTAPLTWADVFGDESEDDMGAKSDSSGASLSPDDYLDEDEHEDESLSSWSDEEEPDRPVDQPVAGPSHRLVHSLSHRHEVEQLQAKQYWRDDYVRPSNLRDRAPEFDIADAETLGPALKSVLAQELGATDIQRETYIDEKDMVRELLIASQGRKNMLLEFVNGSFQINSAAPRLSHLSLTSQTSLLSYIAKIATLAHHLRDFVAFVFSSSSSIANRRGTQMTRTMEAFADAIDTEIRSLNQWCAAREEVMACVPASGKLVVSLLSTQKALQDEFADGVHALIDIVAVVSIREYRAYVLKEQTTAILLDALLDRVQVYRDRGDSLTANMLLRVFGRCAEPIWAMTARWLRVGMSLVGKDELEEEFFIEASGLAVNLPGIGGGLLDPEFWAEGYLLRNETTIPSFLAHAVALILGTGKAVGLLRALGVSPPEMGLRPFKDLLDQQHSAQALSRLVHEELSPHYKVAGSLLCRTLVNECDLHLHLSAVEDLYLMRRGDAMSHFTDVVFAKMDSSQAWGDFHFLNTAFRDVAEVGTEWIQPSLVRLSYRGTSGNRSIKALNNLLVEYAVSFPVAYIFSPAILQIYGDVFTLLLQIRRAKSLLDRILVRRGVVDEMKAFYAVRSRLSWFINTLLDFFTTHVIHVQLVKFHETFKKTRSLDEMIELHNQHIENVHSRCLLQPKTSALHRAILSSLELAVQFCDTFVSLSGNNTLDVSRQSILSTRHRSRRQNAKRRNVVGFASSGIRDEDSSEEDDGDELDPEAHADDVSETESLAEETPIDKLASQLDGLVRFVRRGVEGLSGSTDDDASTFSVLSFALEDWDL
ncbi:unnamed protein product [Mycena citricolor]|uniref:Spindle pole body component n=1 Tax=Mycena citricolor TaxID=2018698 RepID=A0AAD2HEB6_9AGAR|nr:unnamed protein product [Mycena citricolor]